MVRGNGQRRVCRALSRTDASPLVSPLIKAVVPCTFTSTQRHPGQPKDEKDHGQDPKKVDGEPKPSKQQY